MMKDHYGTNKLTGHDAALYLVDILFTRNIMTKYTWAGTAARSGHQQKSCFKNFTNTIGTFHMLVKVADPTYTKLQTELFFKNTVLQHSTRRNKEPVRASRSKRRSKALNLPNNDSFNQDKDTNEIVEADLEKTLVPNPVAQCFQSLQLQKFHDDINQTTDESENDQPQIKKNQF